MRGHKEKVTLTLLECYSGMFVVPHMFPNLPCQLTLFHFLCFLQYLLLRWLKLCSSCLAHGVHLDRRPIKNGIHPHMEYLYHAALSFYMLIFMEYQILWLQ